jgi:hypothetical protein
MLSPTYKNPKQYSREGGVYQAFRDGGAAEIFHSSRAISFPSSGKTTMIDVPFPDDWI